MNRRIVSVYGLCGAGKTTALSQLQHVLNFKYIYQAASAEEKELQKYILDFCPANQRPSIREHLSVALIQRNALSMLLHTSSSFIVLEGMCDPANAVVSSVAFNKRIIRNFNKQNYYAVTTRIYVRTDPSVSYARYINRCKAYNKSPFWTWDNYLRWYYELQKYSVKTSSTVVENNGSIMDLYRSLYQVLQGLQTVDLPST